MSKCKIMIKDYLKKKNILCMTYLFIPHMLKSLKRLSLVILNKPPKWINLSILKGQYAYASLDIRDGRVDAISKTNVDFR